MSLEITVTDEEAQVLQKACEILSRIHCGDFGIIADIPHMMEEELDRDYLRNDFDSLSSFVTGMCHGKFYNLNSKKVAQEARIAHNLSVMIQSLTNTTP